MANSVVNSVALFLKIACKELITKENTIEYTEIEENQRISENIRAFT